MATRERRYSKPAGTKVCDFECERHKDCPAPIEFKCKQEWLKTHKPKSDKAIVIFID